jgi:transcriptional regulator with XRE-family HTH domain
MTKLRVKEILREKNIKAKALAEALCMTEVGLSKAISDNGNPPLKRLQEIADFLNVEIWELFTEIRDKTNFMAIVKDKNFYYSATTLKELEEIVEKIKANKDDNK